MANQVFDTNILRPLERPSAADLNQLQAETYRTIRYLDRLRFGYDLSTYYSGFLNYSFFVQNLVGSGLTLNISKGVGYLETLDVSSNIDGIPGLNDISSYKPIFMSGDKTFTVPADVTAGKCRRDLVEVRWLRDLTDLTDLDIYNPGTQAFSATNLAKTMTTDLAGQAVDFFNAGSTPPATAYLIYKKGVEITYVNDDSWLSAPLPSVDSGCLAIAAINVKNGDTSIPNSRISDLRKLLSNANQFAISGIARIGRNVPSNTQHLSSVDITAPAGVRCTISKLNQYQIGNIVDPATQNQYQFSFFGPTVAKWGPTFTIFGPLSGSGVGETPFPFSTSIKINDMNLSSSLAVSKSDADMLRSSDYSYPAVNVAVGQPYAKFTFSLNVDLYLSGANITNIKSDTTFGGFSYQQPFTDTIRAVSFMIIGQYA